MSDTLPDVRFHGMSADDLATLRLRLGYNVPDVQRIADAGFRLVRVMPQLEPELSGDDPVIDIPDGAVWPKGMRLSGWIEHLRRWRHREHHHHHHHRHEGPTGHGGGWFG